VGHRVARAVPELADIPALAIAHDQRRRAQIGQGHGKQDRIFHPMIAARERRRHVERQALRHQAPHQRQVEWR